MTKAAPRILFIGNRTYLNRGCEAIVRGTMKILRTEFGDSLAVEAGLYDDPSDIRNQAQDESDKGIRSFCLQSRAPRWSGEWFAAKLNRHFGTQLPGIHAPLLSRLRGADIALELGGDNYSLDYGIPRTYVDMDRFLLRRGLPVALWGASVGPFDAEPAFAREMFHHFRGLAGVFVRESESQAYLERNGISSNVHLVADPAFLMDPLPPSEERLGLVIPAGAVGINLSPLLAKYFLKIEKQTWELTDEDLAPWIAFSADIVRTVSIATARPVVLIPHVYSHVRGCDDFRFSQAVQAKAVQDGCVDILRVSNHLTAAELKSVIGRCAVFAGARTHAIIAALSSGVPTLSFSYSMKARGINSDIFGHHDYCLDSRKLTVDLVRDRILALLSEERELRRLLGERIPVIQERALSAGRILQKIIGT